MTQHPVGIWRKSSYSGQATDCVEVRTGTWIKSSYSGQATNCVEVHTGLNVQVRDTKDRDGGTLTIPTAAWTALLHTFG